MAIFYMMVDYGLEVFEKTPSLSSPKAENFEFLVVVVVVVIVVIVILIILMMEDYGAEDLVKPLN